MRLPTRGGSYLTFLCVSGLVLFLLFTSSALAASSFSDVPDTHPYAPAIYDLKGRGIVSGFADGTFQPSGQMTRQQFAKVIVRTLGLTITGDETCRLTVTAADFGQCRRREQSDPRFHYAGTWSSIAQAVASGGSYGRSSTPGASATIYFRGTRLDWIAVKGLTPGVADVYLDGVKQATIDLAAPASTYQVNVWSTGTLPESDHMVEIVRSSSSTPGEYLTLDAVDIWGTMRTGP